MFVKKMFGTKKRNNWKLQKLNSKDQKMRKLQNRNNREFIQFATMVIKSSEWKDTEKANFEKIAISML